MPRRGVVPTFSDLEVIALSITAEAFGIDSENYLFNRLNKECPGAIPNLITRRQYNQRRKLTSQLGEYIRKAIACAIDGGESVFCIDSKPVKVCQNVRANRSAMGKTDIDRAPGDTALLRTCTILIQPTSILNKDSTSALRPWAS